MEIEMDTKALRIDAKRLVENFNALSQIGATPEAGVHRPAFSADHLVARAWFRERVEAAGLTFRRDTAGNHSAILACADPDAPTLLLGSHLDSVPNGGRFDGAFGVLAALEVLQTIRDAEVDLPVNLEAIDFSDEEGTHIGLLGSQAVVGKLTPEDLNCPRGGRQAFLDGLGRAGLEEDGFLHAGRNPKSLVGYLEVHIEQGERLIRAGADIGVVTSIVGLAFYRITFTGRADHAGTTPMQNRLDAAQGASAFTLATRRLVLDEFPDCVANIGRMEFQPGAFNIVPDRATLALEFRAPNHEALNKLDLALLAQAHRDSDRYGLSLQTEFLGREEPAQMSGKAQRAIQQAAGSLELQAIPLTSYAGHDAQSLATICQAGMIFIPSIGGASHSPREFSAWEDCLNGANVLLQATLNIVLKSKKSHEGFR
jgi:N-carbamoyl-L-amino-acid hydrolase